MIHVWFELPDGQKVGRQVVTVPRVGERVRLDFNEDQHHERLYSDWRVADVVNVVAERARYAKVQVVLKHDTAAGEEATWWKGDVDGHHFYLPLDPYIVNERPAYLSMDGLPLEITECHRLRDGGTTIIHTARGSLTIPSRLGAADNTPIWRPARG